MYHPSMLVGWSPDAGELGIKAINFLNRQIGAEDFGDFEPLGFFPLGGVIIEEDVIRFPISRFFSSESDNLIIFASSQPTSKQYEFLNLVLDVAKEFQVKRICTIGGLISKTIAHTEKRKVYSVVNHPGLKMELTKYDMVTDLNYHGSTSMSGFLLWLAKKREIEALSLWIEVPFYLSSEEDPRATKIILKHLSNMFDLQIDLSELEQEVRTQEEKIAQLREANPQINEYIGRLERGKELTEEEEATLTREISGVLREDWR